MQKDNGVTKRRDETIGKVSKCRRMKIETIVRGDADEALTWRSGATECGKLENGGGDESG
jgi:hypothetical protein